jgi:hypothetical protein
MFALAKIANEDRFEDQKQGESCIVPNDLPVERWIAIDKFDREKVAPVGRGLSRADPRPVLLRIEMHIGQAKGD